MDLNPTVRKSSCYYRVTWDKNTLSWTLAYDGQVWATICAYLPGKPPMTIKGALKWADSVVGAQPWERDGHDYRAIPAAVPVHTAANAVPPVDGTDLGDVLEDLADFNDGIDLIRDGIRLIATSRLDLDDTQTMCAALAGSSDGTDLLTAVGHLVARLTHPDSNPSLRDLPFDQQKNTQKAGEALVFTLSDPHLHQHAADASGAIHTD